MTGPLGNLATITRGRSRRASSWDRTGGNDDRVTIPAGATEVLAELDGPAVVRHLWMTVRCDQEHALRRLVLRCFWDGARTPCVEVPLGDFFGIGHGEHRNFWSLPLQMSPEDGRGFNSWFPMPFTQARIELANEADVPAIVYFYVDYEAKPIGDDEGRFHAQWRRVAPTPGISDDALTNDAFQFGGSNLSGDGNYVILEARGEGHYVGCNLNVHNLRRTPDDVFNWYGEGDDMIFVDDEAFPPSLHGTGTEDYFGTAWCPTQEYSSPYHGITMAGGPNWSDKSSLFRFHVEDPVRFTRSIRVTIEHGHANRRSDDLSSTAYWYQHEPHAAPPTLPAVDQRLPFVTLDAADGAERPPG